MPYSIREANKGYNVVNTDTGKVEGHHDSRASAQRQINLLRGVEHGWEPTGKKVKRAAKGVVVDPITGVGPRRATTAARPPGPPQEIRTTRETITGRKQ